MNATTCPNCGTIRPANTACPRCAALTTKPAHREEAPPERFGQYRSVRELGRGGMGRVLEAVDEGLGRRVAVKVLLKPTDGKDVRRQRFIEEARIAGCLEHPGIAPVYNLGQAGDGSVYFSMKLVAGRNLNDILNGRAKGSRDVLRDFPLMRLLSVMERVTETIAYAHDQGILHRDLKPANVMVGDHGEVWVIDWGLAKAIQKNEPTPSTATKPVAAPNADGGMTTDGAVLGTPQYMAPEQAKGHPADVRTDVFGLGAILYKMLAGCPPLEGPDSMGTLMKAALGEITPLRATSLGRRAPAALAAIVNRCLAARPQDRYPCVDALLADLRAYAADEAVKALPDGIFRKTARWCRHHFRAVALVGTSLVLLLAAFTMVSALTAASDRRALEAERQAGSLREQAQKAELARQAAEAESAARAQRRMQAFTPYAEATDLLMRGQRYDQAVRLFDQALQLDADFPEAQFARGEALRLQGQPGPAAEAYLQANALSEKIAGRPHLQALLAAGMAFDGAGDYQRSDQAFQQAERGGANQPLALVGKAFRLAPRARFNEARAAAEEALRQGPHLWETHFACGYVIFEQMFNGLVPYQPARDQSIARLREALELSPRQAEAWSWLAMVLVRSDKAADRAEAIRCYDRAVALEPQNGNRYVVRGLARMAFDPTSATADFQKARELGGSKALLVRAEVALVGAKNDPGKVFRLLNESMRDQQDLTLAARDWFLLGIQQRQDAEVRQKFDQWCRQYPEAPVVFELKGQLKARESDFAGAALEAAAGLKFAPYSRSLRTLRAYWLMEAKNWTESLAAADAVLELVPKDYTGRLVRARCLLETGQPADARALFEQLIADFPGKAKEIEALRDKWSAAK